MSYAFRHLRLLVATLVVAGSAGVAQAGIKSERLLTAIIQRTPAPHLVAEGEQLVAAEKCAAGIPGAQALWGVGSSMEPLYASNTAVVVTRIDYDAIKRGMTVVYVKRNGHRVAHSVVGETRGGYLVQGVNNEEEDVELVTERNFIGIISQAFASADSSFRSSIAQRVAIQGPVRAGDRS